MIPVDQVVRSNDTGDCLRACIASIFELQATDVPNFWEVTQDTEKFWDMMRDWSMRRLGYKCISVGIDRPEDVQKIIGGVLCIASAESGNNPDTEHAVVWKDGMIHDPHPSRAGLAVDPDTFVLFLPLDPLKPGGGIVCQGKDP